MSGVTGWILGFLDGMTEGKWTFRAATFNSHTFACGHWTGTGVSGVDVRPGIRYAIDSTNPHYVMVGTHTHYALDGANPHYVMESQ